MTGYNSCMNKFYVYAHSNNEHGVFYVGKGSGRRLFAAASRSQFWKNIVEKYGYTTSIIEECEDEKTAYEREIFWIDHYKKNGQCCANFTMGGDGVRVHKRWWGREISKSLLGIVRKKGKESGSYKAFADREMLHRLYVEEKMPITEIAVMFEVSSTTVWERLISFDIKIRDQRERKKPIVCVETKQVFASISDAAKELGLFRENIRKVLSKKYKKTGGLTFVYKEKS